MKGSVALFFLLFLSACSTTTEPDHALSGKWQGDIQVSSTIVANMYVSMDASSETAAHGYGNIEYSREGVSESYLVDTEYWAYGTEDDFDLHVVASASEEPWLMDGSINAFGHLCLNEQDRPNMVWCLNPVYTEPFRDIP